MKQLAEIDVYFNFENFIYLPFNCTFLNEYWKRNGSSIRNKTIEDFDYAQDSDYHYYYFIYSLEDFLSTYFSFSITPNATIDNVFIELYIWWII